MKFSKTAFTLHRITSDSLEDFHKKTPVWNRGKLVWCKLDTESTLVKRGISGVRFQYVWMLSEKLNKLSLVPLENVTVTAAITQSVGGSFRKVTLTGEDLNKAMTKVKTEATRLTELAKRQAVIAHGQNITSTTGWVQYEYKHNPIKVKLKASGLTAFTLTPGSKLSVRRVKPDRNLVKFAGRKETYVIDDLKLSLIVNRSANWLSGRFR
jgi:hypothetical protein